MKLKIIIRNCIAITLITTLLLTVTVPAIANNNVCEAACNHKYLIQKKTTYSNKKLYTERKWTATSNGYFENYGKNAVSCGRISVKSIKTKFSLGGSISYNTFLGILSAGVSSNYKKTVQTVKGQSVNMKLSAYSYGQIYTGQFYDVYRVTKTVTSKCSKCKKVTNKSTATYTAKVPLKSYDGKTTQTKALTKKMKKCKDKKGNYYYTPTTCFNEVVYERIY